METSCLIWFWSNPPPPRESKGVSDPIVWQVWCQSHFPVIFNEKMIALQQNPVYHDPFYRSLLFIIHTEPVSTNGRLEGTKSHVCNWFTLAALTIHENEHGDASFQVIEERMEVDPGNMQCASHSVQVYKSGHWHLNIPQKGMASVFCLVVWHVSEWHRMFGRLTSRGTWFVY